jgi:signal transduction histidine kinase
MNLPFEADETTPEGQARIRQYIRGLDAQNPPIGDPRYQHIHFGATPEIRRLRWIPWLQAGGLAMTVLVGLAIIRVQRRAEAEKAWTSMARELAHQLGTPLSSLQGWLEVLQLDPDEMAPMGVGPKEVARGIEEDLDRLGGVSRRFELIGREPELVQLDLRVVVEDLERFELIGREPELVQLDLRVVVEDLERYLRQRLPRMGPGVDLIVDVPDDLPAVEGNPILLQWALENVLKNAMDAVAGSDQGRIELRAHHSEPRWVTLVIADNGPGVPAEVRDRIFDPGVSTKKSGWGVGLALTRRIIRGVHHGRVDLVESRGRGATFQVRLPVATDRRRRG